MALKTGGRNQTVRSGGLQGGLEGKRGQRVEGKHTFPFLPPTSGLLLGGGPQGFGKHRGTVDTDVIEVRLLQEVFFALRKHKHEVKGIRPPHAGTRMSSGEGDGTYRGRFLLLPRLGRLRLGLLRLGFLLHLLHALASLPDAWS